MCCGDRDASASNLLTPIGGDDTLSYALRLHREGIGSSAIPKTMDNDVYGTDYCIGFSTAVTRSVEFITALRTPTGSHERIAVIELFGRNSGETALISSYLADADRAVIPEVPFDVHRLAELIMQDKRANPSNYAIVTVSEGAIMEGGDVIETGEADAYGHRKLGGIGKMTGDALQEINGRGDRGATAWLLDARGRARRARPHGRLQLRQPGGRSRALSGHTGEMVALQKGVYTTVPLDHIGARSEARRRRGTLRLPRATSRASST